MNFQRLLHPERFFLAPAPTVQKLSDAMLKSDEVGYPERNDYRYCAIGGAHYSLMGTWLWAWSISGMHQKVASEFDIPVEIVEECDRKHCGGWTRKQIAEWLKTINY